jgi:Integral membrane protein EMC3/TMCO1-like
MLQKGVEIKGIDVKFISSISLYMLGLFGFNNIMPLLFNEDDEQGTTHSINSYSILNLDNSNSM